MNELLYHSPDARFELDARRERVTHDVALSRGARAPEAPRLPLRAGIAGIAALLGAPARHRHA